MPTPRTRGSASAIIICAALLISGSGAGYAAEWTLDRTVNESLAHANTLDSEELNARLAEIDAAQARGGWYPALSLSSSASVVSEVMEIDMPFKTIRFGDYDSYDIALTVNQLIYDNGRLAAMEELAGIRKRMSGFEADAIRLEITWRARSAFHAVMLADRRVEASRQAVSRAKRHIGDVTSLVSQGLALKNDLLRAELGKAEAEMMLASRTSESDKARAVFRQLTGAPKDDPVRLTETERGRPRSPKGTVEDALASRPEMKALSTAVDAAEKNAEAARTLGGPTLGLYASLHYGKPGLDLPSNEWMHYASGGIRLDWKLLDWGNIERTARKAEIEGRKIQLKIKDVERLIGRQVEEARSTLIAARKRVELARTAFDYAESHLAAVDARQRNGMATETEYSMAHDAYVRAEQERLAAGTEERLAAAFFDYVLGVSREGGTNER